MPRPAHLLVGLAFATLFAAGGGCKCTRGTGPNHADAAAPPDVRLYLVSSPAGALEPCGCVKDMLGGIDHLAAFVTKEKQSAPHSLVLAAGPTFFMDPVLSERKGDQDRWKAGALAGALADLGLRAWAPGNNDWAAGTETLSKLAGDRITPLAANLKTSVASNLPSAIYDVAGCRVGVAGVSVPLQHGALPSGVEASDPKQELSQALSELQAKSAQIKVALVALPRGEALRLAEQVPGFQVLLIGKPVDQGEANDPPTPAVMIGKTLVVQAPNHLQAVAVVDFHVENQSFDFSDGSRTAEEEQRTSLRLGIAELEGRLKRLPSESPDRAGAEQDLSKKRAELERLSQPSPPEEGSFFTYRLVEVRENLGSDPQAKAHLSDYYRQVNTHNRELFKDWAPKPVSEGQASYVGIQACSNCHAEERAFWDTTQHHVAYETLAKQDKQFNLDCVSCHVTGYDRPGGSTVTHVDTLTSVQCETCHGPGSLHVQNPSAKGAIVAKPEKTLCAQCHHLPHVAQGWSADEAWPKIIGKGHGM